MGAEPKNTILSYMRTYATSDAEFEAFDLPAEDIIAGDPKTEVAIHHRSDDGSVLVGVSRFTEGTYRYRQTADEINYVTKGRMIITSDRDDQQIVCTEASVTRLDKGVVYTKTVVEPYEEIFVMLADSSVEM
jgi:uncharacterized cupin superfamily protein